MTMQRSTFTSPVDGLELATYEWAVADPRGVVQVAHGLDFEIEHAVARDLVEHVVEEGHAGVQLLDAGAVKVDRDADLRLVGVADDFCGAGHGRCSMVSALL